MRCYPFCQPPRYSQDFSKKEKFFPKNENGRVRLRRCVCMSVCNSNRINSLSRTVEQQHIYTHTRQPRQTISAQLFPFHLLYTESHAVPDRIRHFLFLFSTLLILCVVFASCAQIDQRMSHITIIINISPFTIHFPCLLLLVLLSLTLYLSLHTFKDEGKTKYFEHNSFLLLHCV